MVGTWGPWHFPLAGMRTRRYRHGAPFQNAARGEVGAHDMEILFSIPKNQGRGVAARAARPGAARAARLGAGLPLAPYQARALGRASRCGAHTCATMASAMP